MNFECLNPECSERWNRVEIEVGYDSPWPLCSVCGSRLRGVAPGVVFTGQISRRYLTREEREKRSSGGHWVWKTRNVDKPERVWIETWQDQRRYIKEEGLADPWELPAHATISEDGRRIIPITAAEEREIREAIYRGEKLPVARRQPSEPVAVERVPAGSETGQKLLKEVQDAHRS